MQAQQIGMLKSFVELMKSNPDIIHKPELKFFKDWLCSLGATLPAPNTSTSPPPAASPVESEEETESDDVVESEVELDQEGCVSEDEEGSASLGDLEKEVDEAAMELANDKRGEAQSAMSDADWTKAVALFTEAIEANPHQAMLLAKRAACFIKLSRPRAAIRDCSRALELNPDCAAAFKFRGRAQRLLGLWLPAAKDLRQATKLDCDESAMEWLKEVQPRAHLVEEHSRKFLRLKEEQAIRRRKREVEKRRMAYDQEKAREAKQREARSGGFPGGMGGGMPGMGGGMPGMGGGMPAGMEDMFGQLFSDPTMMAAMQDPEVMAAFQDVSANPANISKYANNPKIMNVIQKLQSKMGGGGGMPDMSGGGMPDMSGGGGGAPGAADFDMD